MGRVGRNAAVGVLLAGLLAGGGAAQPPLPTPLPAPKVEPPGPLPRGTDLAAERAQLQGRLQELLRQLNERPAGSGLPTRLPLPRPPVAPGSGNPQLDALRAAMNYFREKDYDAALGVTRGIDPVGLAREDRAFVQYLAGCCLRKLNRRSEAAALFREVANAKDDEFLAECAVWQLSLLRSTAEIEAQLESLRSRPKGP